jgi:hypothetical protein
MSFDPPAENKSRGQIESYLLRSGRKNPSLRQSSTTIPSLLAGKNAIAPLPSAMISFAPNGARMGWGGAIPPTACAVGYDLPPALL